MMLALGVAVTPARGADPAPQERYDADNTGRNVRDRDATRGAKATADQQSNNPADLRLTQQIRKAIVDDDSLSMSAHNVKVITIDGVVTLRGPVDSAAERSAVAAKAQTVAGVRRVDNQLEVNER
jgi:osmotically-inducible protein OsmY